MNTETQKIQAMINGNLDFLLANHIDIVHSDLTNAWFVYRFDTNYCYYDYFVQFTTAKELAHILLEELRFLLLSAIDETTALPSFEKESPASQLTDYTADPSLYFELTALLQQITTSELGKSSRFFQTLERILAFV